MNYIKAVNNKISKVQVPKAELKMIFAYESNFAPYILELLFNNDNANNDEDEYIYLNHQLQLKKIKY